MRENGVSDQELAESKSYIVGQNRISLENTSSQMMWAGETLLFFDDWIDPEESHRHIEEVTSKEISAAASLAFEVDSLCSALIGPEASQEVLGEWISACS